MKSPDRSDNTEKSSINLSPYIDKIRMNQQQGGHTEARYLIGVTDDLVADLGGHGSGPIDAYLLNKLQFHRLNLEGSMRPNSSSADDFAKLLADFKAFLPELEQYSA